MRKSSASARHVQRYRERMRRAGLRLVQLWIPDTRAAGFAAECRQQSLRAKRARRIEKDTMDWLDAVRDADAWNG